MPFHDDVLIQEAMGETYLCRCLFGCSKAYWAAKKRDRYDKLMHCRYCVYSGCQLRGGKSKVFGWILLLYDGLG